MKITSQDVIEANRRLGGGLRSDSSLDFAEAYCRRRSSAYRCAAAWVRAIAVDHPFTDANKRTALYAIASHIRIKNPERMALAVGRIASENITSVERIVTVIKNANR